MLKSRKYRRVSNWLWLAAGGLSIVSSSPASAQSNIIPDNTLGDEPSVVNTEAELSLELITGGAQRGNNLFHSFQEFNVAEGRSAYFVSTDANITNILSRVTGNNISEILGTLGTSGASQPNLFLINPNGIIFGENSSLDVGASFTATTANSIQFAEQGTFSATNPETPPLLTVQPSAFFINQIDPGNIQNNSIAEIETEDSSSEVVGLQVPVGENLLFVGGDITLDGGKIFAPGGNVQLAAIGGEETVNLVNDDLLGLNISETIAKGNIFLSDRANIDVTDAPQGRISLEARNINISDFSSLFANSEAGSIDLQATENIQIGRNTINGGSINLQSQSLFLDGTSIIVSNFGRGESGDIALKAGESILIAGGSLRNQTTDVAGGNINIETNSFSLTDGGRISTVSLGDGKPGNVNIRARDSVIISGVDPTFGLSGGISTTINLPSDSGESNQSGDINIDAGSLLLTEEAFLKSGTFDGLSTGGKINLNADNITLEDGATIFTTSANGGSIDIQTQDLAILNSSIQGGIGIASGFTGAKAGDINLNADNSISIESSAIFNQVGVPRNNNATGDGGNISIDTKSLELTNPSLETNNTSQIVARTFGDGDGGNLIINVEELTLKEGSIISTSTGSRGRGGDLTVNAAESIELIGGAIDNLDNLDNPPTSLLSQTASIGQGGNIRLTTPNLIIRDGAGISTQTFGEGQGGNIELQVADTIELIGVSSGNVSLPSGIFSLTSGLFTDNPAGKAGNLTVEAGNLTIREGARIDASTTSDGQAGEVDILAFETIELDGFSSGIFTDTSGENLTTNFDNAGNAGDLEIITNNLNINERARISATTSTDGNGGNITIVSNDNLFIEDNSSIAVSSTGNGVGGNINLETANLSLDNNSLVTAQTFSSDGGNIDLQVTDLLTLDNQSNITATAGTAEAGGNGGNINIDTEFIIAFSNGSNDITANAFEGRGGNIEISAESLFNIEPRLSTPPNDTNDIDASSQFGLNGDISIDTPDVDPARGLENLPNNIVDASRLITRNCLSSGNEKLNQFVITGRGGLPSNPNRLLSGDATLSADWLTLPDKIEPSSVSVKNSPVSIASNPIIEAKNWKIKPDGTVVLFSPSNTNNISDLFLNADSCDTF